MSAYPQPQEQPEEPVPEGVTRAGVTPHPRFAPVAPEGAVVRWSPIFAGVLIAMGISLVLYALGAAIGLTSARPAPVGRADEVLRGAAIWSGATWIISLFVGGLLAGRLGIYYGLRRGVLQGTLVWALYTFVALSIISSGVAGIVGAATNTGLPNAAMARGGVDVNAPQAVGTAATAAWIFFGALVVGWLFAILGGWIGERSARAAAREPVAVR